MNESTEIFFAAVGDVHGHHHEMVRLLSEWEARTSNSIQFVLQVGDFEPHRNEADLETMAAPAKCRTLGDFPEFYSGEFLFPWPVYFIGGNHEPYGFLDTIPNGGPVMENCFYLGRASVARLHGLKITGMSGIYSPDKFESAHPPLADFKKRSNKDYTYFNQEDIERALDFGRPDILLVHDWPARVIAIADAGEFEQQRRSMRYTSVGNEYARVLMDLLSPKLVLCGHMHKKYRNRVTTKSGAAVEVCCLANVERGEDSVAFFRMSEEMVITEVKQLPVG